MAEPAGNPFWDFSLALYGQAPVERACLALQDRRGLDVNLLLFCCWAGYRGRALEAAELRRAIGAVDPWRANAVLPLRTLRRWLKGQGAAPAQPAEALRARIKEAEVEAEAVAQLILAQTIAVSEGTGAPARGAANLRAYCAALELAPDEADIADLSVLLCGCWPELRPLESVALLTS